MQNINSFEKYNKLFLYKKGLINFINLQIDQNKKWTYAKQNLCSKLNNIDYIIGILFLTELNRYCKINDISIHGYYITSALINLFLDIKNKLIYGKEISTESIIFLFNNISNNIEYLNSRIDINNKIRKKINENLTYLILEITPLLNDIVYYKKVHETSDIENVENIWNIHNIEQNINIEENNSKGICNKKCYCCWVNEILTKFVYILLIIAKFMGSGNIKEPNLYKLAEYYSNIFYVILKLDCKTNSIITDKFYQNIYINYQDYKSKLIYSIMELNINSATIDEIIKYLDADITNKFLQITLT